MTEIPVIETERLRLRGYRLSDYSFFESVWKDADVTRFIGGKPRPGEDIWRNFLRMVGHWNLMGFGYWVVEERQSGALMGEVGLADFKRDMTPSLAGMAEAGWVFASSAHGKGYATEAMNAALAWAGENISERRCCCIIEPGNHGSIRVAEKLGFREWTCTTYHGTEIIVFKR